MRLKQLDSQPLRLALTAGSAVVLLSVFAERALYRTSVQAVLNAPRIQLVAPVEGSVDSVLVGMGDAVLVGQRIVTLRPDRWSNDGAGTLGVRVALLRERVAILARQLESLVDLEASLRERAAAYRRTQIVRLEAELSAAVARHRERTLALQQGESLRAVDGVTVADVERLRADAASAESTVKRLTAALASARHGVVVDESGQDAPYSQQRLDQLVIDIARLRAERDALKAEGHALSSGMVATDTIAGGAVVTAPATGVLWGSVATAGARVARGEPVATLVDCTKVYLEATVTPRDGDALRPGEPVLIHFAGQSREYRGTVRAVRGAGVRAEDDGAATLPNSTRTDDSHVIIAIDPSVATSTAGTFCQVGRLAKVTFAEHAPLRPLTRLSAWLD